MSYQATVIRVMIASPADVSDERKVVRDVIHEWNDVNSQSSNLVLLAVGWDTHSFPELGGRPQQLINDRVLEGCDLLIGVFWTRLGSDTGKGSSGTVEEIREHMKTGKPVLLYFSSKPVAPESLDSSQYSRLRAFKDECSSLGLFETFDSVDEFRAKVSRHLQMALMQNEYLKATIKSAQTLSETRIVPGLSLPPVAASSATISEDAATLLVAAAQPKMGMILKMTNLSGTTVQAGDKTFGNEDVRESARWVAALDELVRHSFVEAKGYKGQVFELTHLGWTVSDRIKTT